MFNQKYKPSKFAELIFQNDVVRKRLESYANGTRGDNILLWGSYGTAKSLTAQIIATESRKAKKPMFDAPVDIVHCSQLTSVAPKKLDLRAIEHSWAMSGQKFPYTIMDEFDILTQAQSDAIRAMMDRNEGRAGFILTTNHLNKIDGAIQSRCDVVEMPALSPSAMLPRCRTILQSEGVTLADERLLALVSSCGGDWRKLLRVLDTLVRGVHHKVAA